LVQLTWIIFTNCKKKKKKQKRNHIHNNGWKLTKCTVLHSFICDIHNKGVQNAWVMQHIHGRRKILTGLWC
jgi:hypothetical protein